MAGHTDKVHSNRSLVKQYTYPNITHNGHGIVHSSLSAHLIHI